MVVEAFEITGRVLRDPNGDWELDTW